jgi:hypothetical protein
MVWLLPALFALATQKLRELSDIPGNSPRLILAQQLGALPAVACRAFAKSLRGRMLCTLG